MARRAGTTAAAEWKPWVDAKTVAEFKELTFRPPSRVAPRAPGPGHYRPKRSASMTTTGREWSFARDCTHRDATGLPMYLPTDKSAIAHFSQGRERNQIPGPKYYTRGVSNCGGRSRPRGGSFGRSSRDAGEFFELRDNGPRLNRLKER
mmetsp:Transcript_34717/g.83893  ORF Transcript_34717/g.83893 Transcript_34717/m.83893 type:complete len:149 (-) Transcript_34717:182-628(-)